jgi:hypothetical protein
MLNLKDASKFLMGNLPLLPDLDLSHLHHQKILIFGPQKIDMSVIGGNLLECIFVIIVVDEMNSFFEDVSEVGHLLCGVGVDSFEIFGLFLGGEINQFVEVRVVGLNEEREVVVGFVEGVHYAVEEAFGCG